MDGVKATSDDTEKTAEAASSVHMIGLNEES